MNDLAACELQLVDGPSCGSSGDIRDDPPVVNSRFVGSTQNSLIGTSATDPVTGVAERIRDERIAKVLVENDELTVARDLPAFGDLVGVLLDRGALRNILVEGYTCLRRDLRTRLGVDERPLMIEHDLREGLAGGLALRDEVVEALGPRGERRFGALLISSLFVGRLCKRIRRVGELTQGLGVSIA